MTSARNSGPRVVALGGGHGLSASLRALRQVTDRLTAVVTVADDGGSSGRLRAEYPILPPGDLRMALAALCGDDPEGSLRAEILQARFAGAGPLGGHAIGNLLLAGAWQELDQIAGLDFVSRLLHAQGRVLPMADVPLDIEADIVGADPAHPDEAVLVRGQVNVAVESATGTVLDVRLRPSAPRVPDETLAAVAEADHIVIGPGSWYSSVLPHLLVPQLADALIAARGRKILVMNLASGEETHDYTPSLHLDVLASHAPELRLDTIVIDPSFLADDPSFERYATALGARLVVATVRAADGSPQHDPARLARVHADLMGL